MNTTFRQYVPGQASYAPRRTRAEWENWRGPITSWHNAGVSRRRMCERLAEQGFPVEHGQLVRTMHRWNMRARDRINTSPQPSTSAGSDEATTPPTAPTTVGATANSAGTTAAARRSSQTVDMAYAEQQEEQPLLFGDAPDASTIDTRPLPFGAGACVPSNLLGSEAESRALQKMEAAETATTTSPEIDCCCGNFFKAQTPFKLWQRLYQMLLDADTTDGRSLHYVRALVHLCRVAPPSEALKGHLQSALEHYTELLGRSRIKNDAAYAIALQLAGVCDGLPNEEERAVSMVMKEFFGGETNCYEGTAKSLRDKFSHIYQGMKDLSMLDLRPSENPADWVDNRTEHRQHIDRQLIQCEDAEDIYRVLRSCRKTILKLSNLVDLGQYAQTLRPWSYHEGHTHARAHFERTNTLKFARQISGVLLSNVQQLAWPEGWQYDMPSVSLVFDAMGLMVAQDFYDRGRLLGGLPNDDIPTRLAAATGSLKARVISSMDRKEALLSVNRKLLRAMWICDTSQPLFAPQGLHIGPCRAQKCWDLLGQSVKQFDRTTSVVAPTALPRNLEPQTPDDVSMLSTSTKSSFQRFRRLSVRIRRSSTITMGSGLSKWSGHMSIDSLTPEKVLGAGSEVLGPTLSREEHRRLDEEAFRTMQTIRV